MANAVKEMIDMITALIVLIVGLFIIIELINTLNFLQSISKDMPSIISGIALAITLFFFIDFIGGRR